jgi:hypothetical protein
MELYDLEAAEELAPLGSSFDGGRGLFTALTVLKYLATIASVSLLYPAVVFFFDRWEVSQTRIDGERLVFDGRLVQAYFIYFSGMLFIAFFAALLRRYASGIEAFLGRYAGTILNGINAGLGAILINGRLQKWKARHTKASGRDGRSRLKKNVFNVAALTLATWALGIITLGLSYPLIYAIKETYFTEVSDVSGRNLAFYGGVKDAYKGWIFSVIFIVLTLGLYLLVLEYGLNKWRAQNTHYEVGEVSGKA